MKSAKGFTLIELVVVIVILGLLAAAALPRFINVTTQARVASLQGLAGAINSSAALARAQYIVTGSNAAATVTMDATAVTVLTETGNAGLGGYPTAQAAGIGAAAQINTTQDYQESGGGATAGSVITYQPRNGGSATCQLTYTPNANPRVAIVSTGC